MAWSSDFVKVTVPALGRGHRSSARKNLCVTTRPVQCPDGPACTGEVVMGSSNSRSWRPGGWGEGVFAEATHESFTEGGNRESSSFRPASEVPKKRTCFSDLRVPSLRGPSRGSSHEALTGVLAFCSPHWCCSPLISLLKYSVLLFWTSAYSTITSLHSIPSSNTFLSSFSMGFPTREALSIQQCHKLPCHGLYVLCLS